jgi:hypothetical protein
LGEGRSGQHQAEQKGRDKIGFCHARVPCVRGSGCWLIQRIDTLNSRLGQTNTALWPNCDRSAVKA